MRLETSKCFLIRMHALHFTGPHHIQHNIPKTKTKTKTRTKTRTNTKTGAAKNPSSKMPGASNTRGNFGGGQSARNLREDWDESCLLGIQWVHLQRRSFKVNVFKSAFTITNHHITVPTTQVCDHTTQLWLWGYRL